MYNMYKELIQSAAPGDRMRVEEFFEIAPEDRKAELIEGALIVYSPATDPHENLLGFLLSVLRIYTRQRNLGEVRGSRTALRLGMEYQAYEPDILFVSQDRAEIVKEEGVYGAPDLVVEILSPGTRSLDRGVKRHIYAIAGVKELWLIDPEGEDLSSFYQRELGGELKEVSMREGILRSLAVPGFFLRAEWLWPPSGRLPDEIEVLRALGVL
jgi:Uma2 family endonuclease